MPDILPTINQDSVRNTSSQLMDVIHNTDKSIDLEVDTEHKLGDQTSLLRPTSDTISDESSVEDDQIYDPEDECRQSPRYCTGCSVTRVLMSPMVLLVLGLVGMTYYAYVFQTATVTTLELVLFHFVIAMLLGSYFQCVLLDPGTVPERWHNAIKRLPYRAHFKVKYNPFRPC